MAGILDAAMGQEPQQPQQPLQPTPAAEPRQADEYEQAAYDLLVMQSLQLIFDPKFAGGIVEQAEQVGPAQALADGVLRAMLIVRDSASDAGKEIPEIVMAKAADTVVPAAAFIYVAAEMMDQDEAVEVAKEAFQLGLQRAEEMGMGGDLLNAGATEGV